MSLIQVQNELSTADGFNRRVVVARPAVSVAKGLLAVAALALGYNLINTFRLWAEHPGLNFFNIFMSTRGEDEVGTFFLTLMVWAPIVVIPLALLFWLYARSTAQRVDNAAYRDFSSNGSVVQQRPIGISALNGNTAVAVHLLGHAAVTPDAYEKAYEAVTAHLATLDKKQLKQAQKSLAKVASGPVSTSVLLPGLPAELQFSGAISKSEWVAVIPPSTAGAKTRYFAVKP